MKHALVIGWLAIILAGMSYLFWQNELKYTLPTPVPKKYNPPQRGEHIQVAPELKPVSGKPLFIHFFNPNCPCSKFNVPHVRSLIRHYGDKILFAVVVLSNDTFTAQEIQEKFGENVPVSFDKNIATAYGVYSTPQAILLDQKHALYYRGNYNKSRYCTDKNSNYAQQAIDTLLSNNNTEPIFNQYALKAYGCELPDCRK